MFTGHIKKQQLLTFSILFYWHAKLFRTFRRRPKLTETYLIPLRRRLLYFNHIIHADGFVFIYLFFFTPSLTKTVVDFSVGARIGAKRIYTRGKKITFYNERR